MDLLDNCEWEGVWNLSEAGDEGWMDPSAVVWSWESSWDKDRSVWEEGLICWGEEIAGILNAEGRVKLRISRLGRSGSETGDWLQEKSVDGGVIRKDEAADVEQHVNGMKRFSGERNVV